MKEGKSLRGSFFVKELLLQALDRGNDLLVLLSRFLWDFRCCLSALLNGLELLVLFAVHELIDFLPALLFHVCVVLFLRH